MDVGSVVESNIVVLQPATRLMDYRAWLSGAWGWLFNAWRDVCARVCPTLIEGEDVERRSAEWLVAALYDFSRGPLHRWDARWLKRLFDIALFRLTGGARHPFDPARERILPVSVCVLDAIVRPDFRPTDRGASEIHNILADAALICAMSSSA